MNTDDAWTIYGRIIGERLPSRPTKIDNIHVGPLPYGLTIPDRATRPTFNTLGDNRISESADTQVKSSCYFWVTKHAKDPVDAVEKVEREDLARLQAVLSAHAETGPYRFEVLGYERDNFFQPVGSAMASCNVFCPTELTQDAIETVAADVTRLAKTPQLEPIYRHCSDAIRNRDTAASPQEQESALLSAFKVIEGIANLQTVSKSPRELEAGQAEISRELQRKLESNASLKTKVKAIRESRNALERLEMRFLNAKVTVMAREYQLSDDWEAKAKEFVEFRNSRLGHVAPLTTAEQRKPWTDDQSATSAFALARILMKAYLDFARRAAR